MSFDLIAIRSDLEAEHARKLEILAQMETLASQLNGLAPANRTRKHPTSNIQRPTSKRGRKPGRGPTPPKGSSSARERLAGAVQESSGWFSKRHLAKQAGVSAFITVRYLREMLDAGTLQARGATSTREYAAAGVKNDLQGEQYPVPVIRKPKPIPSAEVSESAGEKSSVPSVESAKSVVENPRPKAPVFNPDDLNSRAALEDQAVAAGRKLIEPFTAKDLEPCFLTNAMGKSYHWLAEWTKQGWVRKVAYGQYQRTAKFGE